MDELYFEEGYLELRYFAVIANASSGSRYFLEGYLPEDYFEYRGSFASVTCDFEVVIIGTTKEFEITVQSQFDAATVGVKTVSGNALFNSEFTQTSIGTRGKDTDLFAFSDAAIEAEVDRIRDNNIDATAVFSVSSEVSRIKQLDTDAFGGFSFIGNVRRSRATEIETQAAFSFACVAEASKEFDCLLSSETISTITAEASKEFDSDIDSEFVQTVQEDLFKNFEISLSVETTIQSQFRLIHDAHLTSFDAITLSCSAIKQTENSASISSTHSVSATVGKLILVGATVRAHFFTFTSRNLGVYRPKNLPTNFGVLTTEQKKFGTHSIKPPGTSRYGNHRLVLPSNRDFLLEAWMWHGGTYSYGGYPQRVAYPYVTLSLGWISFGLSTRSSQFPYNYYNFNVVAPNEGDPSSGYNYYTVEGQFTTDQWIHMAVVQTGTVLSFYVNGQRVGTTTKPPSYFTIPNDPNSSIQIYSLFDFMYVDEVNVLFGNTYNYNANDTTISVPTSARTNTEFTQALWHFDNNFLDDYTIASITHQGAAGLVSQSTISGKLTGLSNLSANLTAQATVTAVIGKLEEINLTAFSDASVSVDATRIKQLDSHSDITVAVLADNERFRDTDSQQSISLSLVSSGERIRYQTVDANIEFTQTASVGKIHPSAQSDFVSNSSISAVIGTLESIFLNAFTNNRLEASPEKITGYSSQQTSTSDVYSLVGVIKPLSSALSIDSNQTVDGTAIRTAVSDLTFTADFVSDVTEFQGVIANATSRFHTEKYYVDNNEYLEDGYFEVRGVDVNVTANAVADIQSNATLTVSIRTDVFAALVTNSEATVVANVVKTADSLSLQSSQASLTVDAVKTTDSQSNLDSEFTVFANGVTGGEINAVIFNTASISATPRLLAGLTSDFSSEFTEFVETGDSLITARGANLFSEFTQTASAGRIFEITAVFETIAANVTVAVKETVSDVLCETRFDITADAIKSTDTGSEQQSQFESNVVAIKTATAIIETASEFALTSTATSTVEAVIHTDSIASQLSVVARVADFFVNADVVANLTADADVTTDIISNNDIDTTLSADARIFKDNDSAANISSSITATAVVIRSAEITISSAMSFLAGVREFRIDTVVYKIPGEGWTYKISGENRSYDIISESRVRKITQESRVRRINGESRIYNIE